MKNAFIYDKNFFNLFIYFVFRSICIIFNLQVGNIARFRKFCSFNNELVSITFRFLQRARKGFSRVRSKKILHSYRTFLFELYTTQEYENILYIIFKGYHTRYKKKLQSFTFSGIKISSSITTI